MDIKSLIILVGFIGLFAASYFTGWYCDKEFRLFLRKTKLSPFKAYIYRFRDAKIKEDKGHAVVCVNFQQLSFLSLIMGIICFVSFFKTKSSMIFLGSCVLLLLMGSMFLFQLYTNTMKYKERKMHFKEMNEAGLEDFRSTVPTHSYRVPDFSEHVDSFVPTEETNNDKIDSLASGREYIKNKRILDDDIFSPFVTDVTSKFTNVRMREEFADGDSISAGKAILKDTIERQLNEEHFENRNSFERSIDLYLKEKEASKNQNPPSTGKDDKQ